MGATQYIVRSKYKTLIFYC